jgi:hypothetical protein
VRRAGRDLSIITYGAMVWTALEAAKTLEAEGIDCEVVDLRTLFPMDEETVLESVARTNKAILLHEATRTGGIGAEIAAVLSERCFEYLDGPLVRVTAPDTPVPYSPPLEEAFLPNAEKLCGRRAPGRVLAFARHPERSEGSLSSPKRRQSGVSAKKGVPRRCARRDDRESVWRLGRASAPDVSIANARHPRRRRALGLRGQARRDRDRARDVGLRAAARGRQDGRQRRRRHRRIRVRRLRRERRRARPLAGRSRRACPSA